MPDIPSGPWLLFNATAITYTLIKKVARVEKGASKKNLHGLH
jgi:hypothetical protein